MLENTYTTDDLVERIGLMRKYYGVKLFVEGSTASLADVVAAECEPHTLNAVEHWEKRFLESDVQPLVVYEALDTVQEELAGVPAVTLYVPVRFAPDQIEKLGMWFRENVQPNMLLSLHIDPRATGGCGFVWNDVYYDFSLHYYLDRERRAITDMFNQYVHE
jgi:hypothetical protein